MRVGSEGILGWCVGTVGWGWEVDVWHAELAEFGIVRRF